MTRVMIADTPLCVTEKVIQYFFFFSESLPFFCEYPYRNQVIKSARINEVSVLSNNVI